MQYKSCTKCGKVLPISDFHKRTCRKDGVQSYCKACVKVYNKTYHEEHTEERIAYNKSWRKANPRRYWAQQTIRDHKRRGFYIQLSVDDIHQLAEITSYCPSCGVKLDYSQFTKGFSKANSPTLDRMNNESFMTIDNVWIICHHCNVKKQQMRADNFMAAVVA